MKHIFFINPAAGKRDCTGECSRQIRRELACWGDEFEIHISQGPGDITGLARRYAATGEELRFYACGGDGTLNELAAGAAGFPNVAITHLPWGSGNDFIKIFDKPEAFSSLAAFRNPEEAVFDLIGCNGDYALNICSVGLDARIGTRVSAYKKLPFIGGSGAYILSLLVNVLGGIAEHYEVEINGKRIRGEQTLICAANGRFYGGGFNPVPEADPTDGMLDVLVIKKVSLLTVARVVGKYKEGRWKELPAYIRHFRTNRIRVFCDGATAINLDGELREASVVDISVAPVKIRFFYPKGLSYTAAREKVGAAEEGVLAK